MGVMLSLPSSCSIVEWWSCDVAENHLSFEALVLLNIADLLAAISSLAALPSALLLQLARRFGPGYSYQVFYACGG